MNVLKWLKWFVEKVFDELEGRDFLVMVIVLGLFFLMYTDKLSEHNISTIMGGIFGYVAARVTDDEDEKDKC